MIIPNTLPGLHLRHPWADNLILRASWTNTISRPTFEQNRFAEEIDGADITVGNPDLDPYEAMNFDASCEYYFGKFGLLGVALFYKDIDEFIFEQTIANASRLGGDLTTFNNGDDGDIFGVEFTFNQVLTFLPSPLDGFGIYANLTLTDSEMTVLSTGDVPSRDVDFLKQSDEIGNIALTYEKYGFFFRIAGTYRSEYLDSLGEVASEDRYIDDHFQVDISSSYTLQDKYTVFLNLININNEPLRAYYDQSDRLSQYEKYGWTAVLGLKLRI